MIGTIYSTHRKGVSVVVDTRVNVLLQQLLVRIGIDGGLTAQGIIALFLCHWHEGIGIVSLS